MKSTGLPTFQNNESVDGLYKASLFKSLFKDRKVLLDGYPAVKKGLAFPEPCLKFGSSSYIFKTTDIVDKIACKHEDKEFQARYKKETGKFDVSCKVNCCPGVFGLVKYEERGSSSGPAYVIGFDLLKGALAWNSKFNLQTGSLKASALFNAEDTVKGLKLAADYRLNDVLSGPKDILGQYNVGFSYASGAGLTAVAFNGDKQLVTLDHSLQVDTKLSAIVETVVGIGAGAKAPAASLGVGYQLDREHQLRARVNQNAQVQVCVKKDFSPNLSLLCATCVDLQGKGGLAALMKPAFGFKVVTKV